MIWLNLDEITEERWTYVEEPGMIDKWPDPWFHRYTLGQEPARFPLPALPTKVEWVFENHWFGNGIFVRECGWIVAGAFEDGLIVERPIEYDNPNYCQTCGMAAAHMKICQICN